MKTRLKLLLALLALQVFCLGFAATAATQPICPVYNLEFDIDKITPQAIEAYHGEKIEIYVNLKRNGLFLRFALPELCTFYWQEVGMGDQYWSNDFFPECDGNSTFKVEFLPEMDTGAKVYNCFIATPAPTYRAAFQIRMRPSPGAEPAVLPLPVKTLDFDKVKVENAPYYTKDEADAATDAAIVSKVTKEYVEGLGITGGGGGTVEVDTTLSQAGMAADAKTVGDNFAAMAEDYHQINNISGLAYSKAEKAENRVEQFSTWSQGHMQEFNGVNAKASVAFTTANEAKTTAESAIRTANQASEDVSELKTWALGNDVAVKVEHATEPNATFSVLYHGETQYSSDSEAAATVARANEYTDNHLATLAGVVDEKLEEKADRAWGKYTSGGAPANGDTLIVEKKSLAITGGGNFTYIDAGEGGYYVATVSLGNKWTIESLADAQNPDNPTTLTWKDSDGNAIQTITSTSSREVYCVAGVDMMAPSVDHSGSDDVVTLPFPVVSSEAPKVFYVPNLDDYGDDDFAEATPDNWPDYIKSVPPPTGASGNWRVSIVMNGKPRAGFFKGKFIKDGTVYTRFDKPIGIAHVVVEGISYSVKVETVNGKKLLVLTED